MPAALEPPFDPSTFQTNAKLAFALAPSLAIFPCGEAKTPVYGVPWKSARPGQIERVRKWWTDHPDAMPGIHMGAVGLIGIDADGAKGVSAFEAICEPHGGVPECPMIDTPSGGRHYYFRQRPGEALGNGRGSLPPKSVCPVDVRGDGGYLIAPDATREDGVYLYPDGDPLDILQAPELPEWLHDILSGKEVAEKAEEITLEPASPQASGVAAPAKEIGHQPGRALDMQHPRLRAWVEKAFDDEIQALAQCGRGGRNNQLNASAFAIFQLVAAGWVAEDAAHTALMQVAETCGLVKDDGRRAVLKTISSARRGGMAQPREVPEEFIRDEEIAASAVALNRDLAVSADGTLHDATTGEVIEGPLRLVHHGEAEAPPPPMLVRRLLPRHGIAFLGGQSGAGKTFVAVDLAVASASGQPFFGQHVKERVGVAILAGEGAATLGSRIRVACEARSIEDRLAIVWGDVSSDLNNNQHFAAVIAQLTAEDRRFQFEHGCRLGVVILDTLAACFSLKDENSNAEAAVIIRRAKMLADALGALVVLVHHYGKASETGLRGASAWRAGADAVLAVQADRNEMSGRISNRQIVLTKSRTHEEGWLRPFSLKHVPIGHDEDGEPIGSCVVADAERDEVVIHGVRPLTGARKSYYDALCAALGALGRSMSPFGSEGSQVRVVEREEVRREFYAARPADGEDEQKRSAALRQAFNRAEDALRSSGHIVTREVGGETLVWVSKDVAGNPVNRAPDTS